MFNEIIPDDRLAFWKAADEVIEYRTLDLGVGDTQIVVMHLQTAASFWDVPSDKRDARRRFIAAGCLLSAIEAAEQDDNLHFWLSRLCWRMFRTCPAHGEHHMDGGICRVCGEDVQPVAVQVAAEIDDEIPV